MMSEHGGVTTVPGVLVLHLQGGQEAAVGVAAAAAISPAGVAAAAPPAPAAGSVWQVHHTAEGRAYYYNSSTGVTQWEVPPGM